MADRAARQEAIDRATREVRSDKSGFLTPAHRPSPEQGVELDERVARAFHAAYEELAPEHGYETREESRRLWGDIPEKNRALMIGTVRRLLTTGVICPPDERERREAAEAELERERRIGITSDTAASEAEEERDAAEAKLKALEGVVEELKRRSYGCGFEEAKFFAEAAELVQSALKDSAA